MCNTPLRIGLVGAGGIARIHRDRHLKIDDVKLVAICDVNEEAARNAASEADAEAFTSMEEMLASVRLDAVDICTPPASHLELAMGAIAAGLHVLCEKPLADTVESARDIVDAAQQKGVLLMTAFCHRFHPPVVFLKDLITAGEMGDIVMFRNRFAGPAPQMASKWFSRKAVAGGGALMDTSIHSIDLFRYLVGEVDRAEAVMRTTSPDITEVEDTAIALLSTADNRMGVVEASWALPGDINVIEVYGTKGTACVHYWDGMQSCYKLNGMEEWTPLPESGTDRFAAEIQHFAAACLGRTALTVTGYDGLRAVEIAASAYRSAGM